MFSRLRSGSCHRADEGAPGSRRHCDGDGKPKSGHGPPPLLGFWTRSLAAGGFFGLLFFCVGSFLFGSIDATWAFLSGQTLYVPTSEIEAVRDSSGQFALALALAGFEIRNLSFSPCDILGARTDCDCTVVDDLPTRIAPLTTGLFKVRIAYRPSNVAENSRVVELLTRASVNSVKVRILVPDNRE